MPRHHCSARQRTALMNQLRAILLERGVVVRQGPFPLNQRDRALLDDDADALSPRVRLLVADMLEQWRSLDERIAEFDVAWASLPRYSPPSG